MKRTKLLALTLVVAIMMMGAGYAWWSDTLVVNSEVKSGYLDVDFTSAKLVSKSSNWISAEANSIIQALPGDGVDFPNGSKDNVIIKLGNLYPGAKVVEKITVKNEGTIPVKVPAMDIVAIPGSSNADLLAKMDVSIGRINYPRSLEEEMTTMEIEPLHGGGHPNPTPTLLDPGKTLEYEITFELKDTATNDITENQTVNYSITAVYEQFNKR